MPTMSFLGHTYVGVEGETTTVYVRLSSALQTSTTVTIQVDSVKSSATLTDDFTLSTTTLTFGAGDTTKSFTVPVLADMTTEGEEILYLDLVAPASAPYTLADPSEAEIAILDDSLDPGLLLALSTTGARDDPNGIVEGQMKTLTAGLSDSAPAGGVTVTLTVATASTATEGASNDYTLSAKTIAIAQGNNTGSVTVTAVDDTADDNMETIVVNASVTVSGEEHTATKTIIIWDNDGVPDAPLAVFVAAGFGRLDVGVQHDRRPPGTVTGLNFHYTSATETAVADTAAATGNDPTAAWVDTGSSGLDGTEIRGLTGGRSYRLRGRAVNASGNGPWAFASGTPLQGSGPSVPQNVQATPGDAKLTITWQAPSSWGTWSAAPYDIQWQLPGDGLAWSAVRKGGSAYLPTASETSFEFTGNQDRQYTQQNHVVMNGTAYQFRMRAASRQSSRYAYSDWVTVSGTPELPNVPTGLTVTAGDAVLTASWTAPANVDVSRYEVQIKLKSAANWPGTDTDVTSTSYVFTSLVNASRYQVRVRTVELGEGTPGDWTDPVEGTPHAPGTPTVSLSASPNPVTEGSPVTVTATLSEALSSNVTIPLTVTDDTAEPDDHGTPADIVIAAGSTSDTSTITTNQDEDTVDEIFTVALGNLPSSVVAGSLSSVDVTIRDDDGASDPPPDSDDPDGDGDGDGGGGDADDAPSTCTLAAPYWSGPSGGFTVRPAAGRTSVSVTCGARTKEYSAEDGVVTRLVRGSCPGGLRLEGAAPGGWYWQHGERNAAAAPFVCREDLGGPKAVVPGGVVANATEDATWFRHDTARLVGIVPHLEGNECSQYVTPYWQGDGGVVVRPAEGRTYANVQVQCGATLSTLTASAGADGVAAKLVRKDYCTDDEGEARQGKLTVTGAAPGGWYWIDGERNAAAAPLMCADLLGGPAAVEPGGVFSRATEDGTYFSHETDRLIGVVPHLVPDPDE